MATQKTFTVEEIRKYIEKQDSLGDVLYNLTAVNIVDAQKDDEPEEEEFDEDDVESEFDEEDDVEFSGGEELF